MAEAKKKTSDAAAAKNNTSVPVTKKVETAVAPVVSKEVKPEPKKDAPKKEEPKKETPKKATTKKTSTTKKGMKRGPKPAAERTIELQVQFGEKQDVTYSNLVNNVKEWWKEQGKREVSLKSLNIYLKPEDNMAYCIINDKVEYNIDLSNWN